MTARFQGFEVISTGPGQCPLCATTVTRVLVKQAHGRAWYTTDERRGQYEPHQCPGQPVPPEPPPYRQAA